MDARRGSVLDTPRSMVEMRVTMTHLSDTGRVRSGNEDSVLCVADPTGNRGSLLVVADGMGGAAGGEVASRIAIETVAEVYFGSPSSPDESLGEALREANRRIHRAAFEKGRRGMGTTCSALALVAGQAAVAQVGDSRVYRYRGGDLSRLTRVHSVWAEAVSTQRIAPSVRDGQNVLTRALGGDGEIEVDVIAGVGVEGGDIYLLCSDGLWGQVTDAELAWALEHLEAKDACAHLVTLANDRGGPDNVTVALGHVG